MAGTLIGTAWGSNAASMTVSVAAGVPAGSLVVVAAAGNSGTITATVTDSRSNTYANRSSTGASGGVVITGAVASSVLTTALQAGDSLTVVIESVARSREACIAAWYPDADSAVPDKVTSATGSTGTAAAPGASGTLAKATETVVLAVGGSREAGAAAASCAGYTADGYVTTAVGSNERGVTLLSKDVTDTASQAPTATLPGSNSWTAILATFATTPAGPATSPTVRGVIVGGVEQAATLRGVIVAGVEQPGTVREVVGH